ncbi:MAG TPA: hypothetical protein VGH15_09050 [Caulobacteraceae bacterium]
MKGADKEKREKLANALAEGLNRTSAAARSGYAPQTVSRLRKNPEFRARVEKLRDERDWGGSPDLAPVVNELIAYARKAARGDTAADLNCARQYLVEIARLKQQMAANAKAEAAVAERAARGAEIALWAAKS